MHQGLKVKNYGMSAELRSKTEECEKIVPIL